jgi:hypothetical protein
MGVCLRGRAALQDAWFSVWLFCEELLFPFAKAVAHIFLSHSYNRYCSHFTGGRTENQYKITVHSRCLLASKKSYV